MNQLKCFVTLQSPKYITDSLSLIRLIARKRLYTDRIKHFINELSHIKYSTTDGNIIHCTSGHMVMDVLTKLNIPIKQQKYLTSMIYDVKTFLTMDQFLNPFAAEQNDFDEMTDEDITNYIYTMISDE